MIAHTPDPRDAEIAQLTADNAALRADLTDARSNWESGAEELRQADLVREQLVAALKEARRAIGDHYAPNDCYATGPATGDPVRDLVQCPACSAIAMHDDALKAAGGPVLHMVSRAAVDTAFFDDSPTTITAAQPCHCAGPETGVRCVPGCDAALSTPDPVRPQLVAALQGLVYAINSSHPDAADMVDDAERDANAALAAAGATP